MPLHNVDPSKELMESAVSMHMAERAILQAMSGLISCQASHVVDAHTAFMNGDQATLVHELREGMAHYAEVWPNIVKLIEERDRLNKNATELAMAEYSDANAPTDAAATKIADDFLKKL